MDKYITSEKDHGLNPRSQLFEPLTPFSTNPPRALKFHLIISDPNSDSSLTPNWSVPEEPFWVPVSIPISGFLSRLKDFLPVASSSGVARRDVAEMPALSSSSSGTTTATPPTPGTTTTNTTTIATTTPEVGRRSRISSPSTFFFPSSSSSSSTPNTTSTTARRPKLASVHLFLMTRTGKVVPLCDDPADWYYTGGGIAKVDLLDKTDAEWRFLKELVVAGKGEVKCYVAIKAAPTRSVFFGRGG